MYVVYIFDDELGFNNYNVYRNYRILSLGKTRGGRVLIATKILSVNY